MYLFRQEQSDSGSGGLVGKKVTETTQRRRWTRKKEITIKTIVAVAATF